MRKYSAIFFNFELDDSIIDKSTKKIFQHELKVFIKFLQRKYLNE